MHSQDQVLTIPHDFEAEQCVLGSLIFENDNFTKIARILNPNSFHTEAHRHIYSAILEITEKNQPFDEIIIGDQLKTLGKIEEIGGYAYLAELVECVPSAGNIVYYAKIIQEHALVRDLISITSDIGRKSRDPQQNIRELLAEATEKIKEITSRSNQSSYTHIKDILFTNFKKLEEISEDSREITGLGTGFIDLDRVTAGLQPSDLIIIAARPSMGKTALAMNIASYAATRGSNKSKKPNHILIFSLEMSKEQLGLRILTSESKIESKKMRTGNLEQEDWDRLSEATDKISGSYIYINDNSALTPFELVSIAKELDDEIEDGLSLIILDYLQLMQGNKKTNSREQEIAEISRSLKGLAKDLDIPIIALSQLNRQLENRTDKEPRLSDLRESGSIEQDADIILFIYRDEIYNEDTEKKGIAKIIIAKHRNGPTGYVDLVFIAKYTRFVNLATYGFIQEEQ